MSAPHSYSKRILLAVSGMSPQIVTETLYALTVAEKDQPFIPTEIHLISTTTGKNRAVLELLHPQTGKFHQLCQDYGLKGIQFCAEQIYVIPDKHGVLLDDIKTPEENEAAADFITQKVNELTRDTDSALHVSIAGGRKTMGYYLGYALSLFGRAQDRLSHVLVTANYEGLPAFFYPTPESHVIYDRDKNPLDTNAAEVILASIPFVRLRTGLPKFLLEDDKTSFSESIRLARTAEADPWLEVDLTTGCLSANGYAVPLSPINFAFYLWMIQESVFKAGGIKRSKSSNPDYASSFLTLYQNLSHELKDIEITRDRLTTKNPNNNNEIGMDSKWMNERMTAVKKSFKKALDNHVAQVFLVTSPRKNNHKTYAIALTEQQVIGFTPADCDG